MAGGIWGDGPRGGIFGARIDPRLQAELEQRAKERRSYETSLSPMEERQFRDWKQRFAPRDSGADYDLRGAFKAGFQPDPETGHWPDVYKKPNHPTFSDQSIYAKDRPELAGSWNGDTYVPAQQRRELEARPTDTRPDFERQSMAARILAAPSKLFGGLVVDPAVEGITDLATLAGDVYAGRQATMSADPQTGEMRTDPRLSERTANAAGALTLGAGAIPAEANALRMGIKAYHGSPHDFERFDASKIGTGEGAQAYGHGLYFAEREGVAKDYRDKLVTDPRDELNKYLEGIRGFAAPEDITFDAIKTGLGRSDYGSLRIASQNDEIVRDIVTVAKGQNPDGTVSNAALTAYNRLDKVLGEKSKGSMYEVSIAAEPEQFLDWDKPLAEQSPRVRELLEAKGVPNKPHVSGSSAYMHLVGDEIASGRVKPDVAKSAGHAEVSQSLREAGIPGIRYLDQGSRSTFTKPGLERDIEVLRDKIVREEMEGTNDPDRAFRMRHRLEALENELAKLANQSRNYVVFDDKLISILKKYGLPISAAGLAALHELHPKEAQAAERKDKRK